VTLGTDFAGHGRDNVKIREVVTIAWGPVTENTVFFTLAMPAKNLLYSV
jgi:hypothetical protein